MVDEAQPIPFDYNDAVFRHGAEARGLDSSILRDEHSDVHGFVADQLMLARLAPVLDIGCGPAKLGKLLDERGVSWMGVDAALPRLRLGTGPRVQGDACRLPFPDESFGAAAALYTLYHFGDPTEPIREAHRVLRTGGLFVVCAPSRFDDPELAPYTPARPPETFDSELAPELFAPFFGDIRENRWEMALYRFANRDAAWTYLVARGASPEEADNVARQLEYPFWVTKRGAITWGRKR